MSTFIVADLAYSRQEQMELGKKMTEGDMAAREKLIMCCVPVVKRFSKSVLSKYFANEDDVFQDGMLGAMEAIDSYDYTRNTKFTTFAYTFIHKSILRGVIAQLPVKVSSDDFFNSALLRSTVDTFIATNHVPPTDEQLVALTNIPLKSVKLLQSRNINDMVVSLSAPGENLLNVPREDVGMMVERILTESARKQLIADALECLTDDEKEIVQLRMMRKTNKVPLRELAEQRGVTPQAIAKREKLIARKLLSYFIKHNVDFEDWVC